MIGPVQVGVHGMVDRYTCLLLIGISVGVVWGAFELARARPSLRRAGQVLAACAGALRAGATASGAAVRLGTNQDRL
jgi:hypothetical protein